MKKSALIIGVTGQDGSYLAELLLAKGYEVTGLIRRSSSFTTQRIDHLFDNTHVSTTGKLRLLYGDLSDSGNLNRVLEDTNPDEIYNLGAQSHVHISFQIPEYTSDVNGIGAMRVLDAIKKKGLATKFYQASSSELFGKATEVSQTETTPFHPRSPYACAKLFAYWVTINYREAYGLFACNGILFNHESPRRGEIFVTRKITRAVARIRKGKQDRLFLGNLEPMRDWGYAKEYVEAMWLMMQQDEPDDYVIATNESHSVREFCECAFSHAGYDIAWEGRGIEEKGIDRKSGKTLVEVDAKYFRPAEVDSLQGDFSKAKRKFGWEPRTRFKDLVALMVDADMKSEGI
jgi:GDPmannose 4,6-dehydratase